MCFGKWLYISIQIPKNFNNTLRPFVKQLYKPDLYNKNHLYVSEIPATFWKVWPNQLHIDKYLFVLKLQLTRIKGKFTSADIPNLQCKCVIEILGISNIKCFLTHIETDLALLATVVNISNTWGHISYWWSAMQTYLTQWDIGICKLQYI